ncbi:unnamed protein product [Microthlaspi erraticum]|uniref:Prolamin-like domain-containing protein n=1 Tax=Microthlaspi erraticum TaxID=1685480 RepID=A0A6D2I780_9BRAS|nr:unnamed protein product [Microthlaspi erraticum]
MKSFILTTLLLVALLCLISLPISTFGLPKIPWPKPSELAVGHPNHEGSGRLGVSKVGWACTSVTDPNAPPSPPGLLPELPNIPGLPSLPELPNIPGPNIPGLPSLPGLPGLPGLPSLPDLPYIPYLPRLPPLPGLPPFPDLPRLPPLPPLPGLPALPGLPGLPPLPPFQPVVLSQSVEMQKCLTKDDGSKTTDKCFSQIFSSWAEKDFALDKECCEIIVKMDKKCNSHVHTLFKSRFFVPLLQYSCHIKHTKH